MRQTPDGLSFLAGGVRIRMYGKFVSLLEPLQRNCNGSIGHISQAKNYVDLWDLCPIRDYLEPRYCVLYRLNKEGTWENRYGWISFLNTCGIRREPNIMMCDV